MSTVDHLQVPYSILQFQNPCGLSKSYSSAVILQIWNNEKICDRISTIIYSEPKHTEWLQYDATWGLLKDKNKLNISKHTIVFWRNTSIKRY